MQFHDDLSFAKKPAAIGMPRSPVFCPASVNDRRDPNTAVLTSRVGGFWPADVERVRDTLTAYPQKGLLVFNTEGSLAMATDAGGDPQVNMLAIDAQAALLALIGRLRPDLRIAYNALPLPNGELWKYANPAALHAEARRLAADVRAKILPKCSAGIAEQLYFNDVHGGNDTYNWWGGDPDDARMLRFGWAHGVHMAALRADALGVPLVAIFRPSYAPESGDKEGLPLPPATLTACLSFIKAYGVADVVVWGDVRQGKPITSPDGQATYEWDDKAAWWGAVRAFLGAGK